MPKIHGVFTAIITPFDNNKRIDEEGYRYLIKLQLEGGVHGIVALGTTGEDPTLSEAEKIRIIKLSKEEIKNATLIVGTGSNSTSKTIENTLQAEKLGADIALIMTPYYNKPTQEGIYLHFKAITEQTKLPILVYNVQGRTGQNIQTETMKRLMGIPTIVGVKETSGNVFQMNDVIEKAREYRPDFSILSGDDALTLPLISIGGDGIISVASNLCPKAVVELYQAAADGDFERARELHYQLMPFFRHAFIETNPIPIKAAMTLAELPSGGCRLPLCDLQPENLSKLKAVLEAYFS